PRQGRSSYGSGRTAKSLPCSNLWAGSGVDGVGRREDRKHGLGVPGQSSSAAFLIRNRKNGEGPSSSWSLVWVRRRRRSVAKIASAPSSSLLRQRLEQA